MTDLHELGRQLSTVLRYPALSAIALCTVLNVLAALANAFAFSRTRRRWRRVQARERRLNAGPITAAVGAFARAAGE